jgi:hypothetical protein
LPLCCGGSHRGPVAGLRGSEGALHLSGRLVRGQHACVCASHRLRRRDAGSGRCVRRRLGALAHVLSRVGARLSCVLECTQHTPTHTHTISRLSIIVAAGAGAVSQQAQGCRCCQGACRRGTSSHSRTTTPGSTWTTLRAFLGRIGLLPGCRWLGGPPWALQMPLGCCTAAAATAGAAAALLLSACTPEPFNAARNSHPGWFWCPQCDVVGC